MACTVHKPFSFTYLIKQNQIKSNEIDKLNKICLCIYIYDKGMIVISCVLATNALVNGSGGEYPESGVDVWTGRARTRPSVISESGLVCSGISESNTTGRESIKSTYFNLNVK